MIARSWYGKPLPCYDETPLPGKLIVIEGSDGVGRSTQVQHLVKSLSARGYPVRESGLKRSAVIGRSLRAVMEHPTVCPRTLALFYASDFAEMLERNIVPALSAGFVVLADRYFFSLLARGSIRGVPLEWLEKIYQIALRPDLTIYLDCPPEVLAERSLRKRPELDYWEAGLDLGRGQGLFQSFVSYQTSIRARFRDLSETYGMVVVDAAQEEEAVAATIAGLVAPLFG